MIYSFISTFGGTYVGKNWDFNHVTVNISIASGDVKLNPSPNKKM